MDNPSGSFRFFHQPYGNQMCIRDSPYPFRSGEHSPVDLAGFIRDNWYFYRSMWMRKEPTVHLLPHWNMDVEKGKIIPVICYTSCPSVELFLNGKSYGEKAYLYPAVGIDEWPNFDLTKPYANTDDLFLSWDVPFEEGELIAIGYDLSLIHISSIHG